MSRLTQKDERGRWCLKGMTRDDFSIGKMFTGKVHRGIWAVIMKLKEYEDTGCTPEQIREFDALYLEKCQEVNELRKRMQWIPATERLPENGTRALVTFEDGFVAATDYYSNGWDLWAGSGDVIAWMPLPELYRGAAKRPKIEQIIIDDAAGKRAVEIAKAGGNEI